MDLFYGILILFIQQKSHVQILNAECMTFYNKPIFVVESLDFYTFQLLLKILKVS